MLAEVFDKTGRTRLIEVPDLFTDENERLESLAESNRKRRNVLLSQSDWTQMSDSPLDDQTKEEWRLYRQDLRDVTLVDSWPELSEEDWPTSPTEDQETSEEVTEESTTNS